MKIGVLGTGMVGQTIATKLASLDHEVRMGSREAGNEKAVAWAKDAGGNASEGSFAEAAKFGELVVNCTAGVASVDVLTAAGADNLAGKVLVDIANPLDASQGFPPTLAFCNDDSLGERIQAAFPEARVVKTLNTMNHELMVDPARVPGEHAVFVSGDDADAKGEVGPALGRLRLARGPDHRPRWHLQRPRHRDVPAPVAEALQPTRDRRFQHRRHSALTARAAALKKCKRKFRHNKAKRRKCKRKANLLPV